MPHLLPPHTSDVHPLNVVFLDHVICRDAFVHEIFGTSMRPGDMSMENSQPGRQHEEERLHTRLSSFIMVTVGKIQQCMYLGISCWAH